MEPKLYVRKSFIGFTEKFDLIDLSIYQEIEHSGLMHNLSLNHNRGHFLEYILPYIDNAHSQFGSNGTKYLINSNTVIYIELWILS